MSTISSALSPFDFTRLKPLASKKDDPSDPNDPAALKTPSPDLMRMIEGLMAGKTPKKSAPVGTDPQALFAPVTVNGKIVATLTNSDDNANADPLGTLVKLDTGSDATQKNSAGSSTAAGGSVAKGAGALTQTPGAAALAGSASDVATDAVAREKQRWYSGLQERSMIANPSMLVQAQLFAQQMGQDMGAAPQPPSFAPVDGDTMSSGSAAT